MSFLGVVFTLIVFGCSCGFVGGLLALLVVRHIIAMKIDQLEQWYEGREVSTSYHMSVSYETEKEGEE